MAPHEGDTPDRSARVGDVVYAPPGWTVIDPDGHDRGEDAIAHTVGTWTLEGPCADCFALLQVGDPEQAALTPPVAVAGADQSVDVGDLVALDGTGSWDPDGDTVTYV